MLKKHWSLVKFLALSLLFLSCTAAFAQPPGPGEELVACGACGGTLGVIILIVVAIIVLNLALLVWVARDAKARGMDSAVMWMILVMVTGIIGLIIYLFARPRGELVRCSNCQNNRLQASVKCPHCGSS